MADVNTLAIKNVMTDLGNFGLASFIVSCKGSDNSIQLCIVISDNNDNNMILVGTLCFLSTLHQWLAALHGLSSPRQASGC